MPNRMRFGRMIWTGGRLLPALYGLAAWCLVGGGGCQRQISDARIDVITLAEAVDYHESSESREPAALFLDARRDSIFMLGTIRGARQLRPDDVDLRAGLDPKLEEMDALVVFGQDPSSAVARAMCKRLLEAGYNSMLTSRVKFYPGGYDEWLATGLPIETPTTED
ncbi:MAG: rhodanese-like domain-containing protein [Planctomycetota bacterium]